MFKEEQGVLWAGTEVGRGRVVNDEVREGLGSQTV